METVIISLGGSIIHPGEIEVGFLKKFRDFILNIVAKDFRIVIITGGGSLARDYQNSLKSLGNNNADDLDWIGIHATRMNAELLKHLFNENSDDKIIINPEEKIVSDKKILIGAGWKPGFSTDYDSVLIAKQLKAEKIINLSNIKYVYDSDPNKNENAKAIKEMTWKQYREISGDEWDPGLNLPFDPIAAKESEKIGLKVIIMDGKNLTNLKKYFEGKEFEGTIIF